MGLLDAMQFDPSTYAGEGGLLGRLKQMAMYQNPNAPSDTPAPDSYMNVGNYRMPVFGQADPNAVLPANAQMTAGQQPQNAIQPVTQPQQQAQSPTLGESLMAGLDGFANARGPLPAIAAAIKGFATGNSQENMTIKALTQRGLDADTARTVARDPAMLRSVLPKLLSPDHEYGMTPIYGTNEKGEPVIMQLGKTGTPKLVQTPSGVKISTGIEKIDAGTHWVVNDKRSGQNIGIVPKDLRGAEREKGVGEAQGKAVASAPSDIDAGNNALGLLNKIRNHPGIDIGTGATSIVANKIPSTPGFDFQNMVDQAKSGAFLTAIQQMRGLGALSNAEGSAATAAITRMNTATSKKAFLDALADYETIIQQGVSRARGRLADPSSTSPQPIPQAPTNPGASGAGKLPNGWYVKVR